MRKRRLFTSIRAKITLLLTVGLLLLCVSGAVSIFIDWFKNQSIDVAINSQEIALRIAESMLVEEQFITGHDPKLLLQIAKAREEIDGIVKQMQARVQTKEIKTLLTTIHETINSRYGLFDQMKNKFVLIENSLKEFETVLKASRLEVTHIIELIDMSEHKAIAQGATLSTQETGLLNRLNALLETLNKRDLAIQSLYVQSDFAAFQKIQQAIGALDETDAAINASGNDAYTAAWKNIVADWVKLGQLETVISKELRTNLTLKYTLKSNGDHAQVTIQKIVERAKQDSSEATKISRWVIIAVFLTGMLLFGIVGIPIVHSIQWSLRTIIASFEDLVEGESNLTKRLHVISHDELGNLAHLFNLFLEKLHGMVKSVQQSGIQVTSSSTELAAMAKQQEVTVKQQADSTNDVVKSVKEISDVTAELLKTMQQVAMMLQETALYASAGQTGLERMETTMRRMADASQAISGKLEAINEKTEKITAVVTTITKVSEQTNLLSLNAAIEAEKAGEYGRGFTVVAREIRRLADQTAVATLDIDRMVQGMQSAVSAGVMEMDKFIAEVRHSVEDVAQISTQLTRIIAQVQALSPSFEHVNAAMGRQSAYTQSINTAMSHLGEEMEQTKDSLHESYAAIAQLDEAARGLQEQVSRFKVQ